MGADIDEAPARTKDAYSFGDDPVPVVDVGVDERTHGSIKRLTGKRESSYVALRQLASVTPAPGGLQLVDGHVDPDNRPAQLGNCAEVHATSAAQVDTAARPAAEPFTDERRRTLGEACELFVIPRRNGVIAGAEGHVAHGTSAPVATR